MIVLGALLMAVTVVVSIGIGLRATQAASIDLWWFTVNTTVSVFYFTGLVLMTIGVLGLWLLFSGIRRARRRQKEMQDLRARAERNERPREEPSAPAPPPGRNADDYFDSAPRDEQAEPSAEDGGSGASTATEQDGDSAEQEPGPSRP